MRRYLFYLLISVITFAISIGFVTVWICDLYSRDFDEVKQPQYLKVESLEPAFDCLLALTPRGVCDTLCTSAEGKAVRSSGNTYPKQQAHQVLNERIKDAKIIFISVSDKQKDIVKKRVVIEKNDKIKILNLSKVDEKTDQYLYFLEEIESADFKTAIAFENRKNVVQEQFLRLND